MARKNCLNWSQSLKGRMRNNTLNQTMNKFLTAILFILSGLMFLSCAREETEFDKILAKIKGMSAAEQNRFLDDYVNKRQSLPLVQENAVWFLLKDTTQAAVYLSGDMCAWKADSLEMQRIGRSSYYYIRRNFPLKARLEYKFVVNGKYLLDPVNPLKDRGGYGENSLLLMPDYRFPQEVLIRRNIALTKLDTLYFASSLLKNKRTIYFYHHRQAKPAAPLIVFQDGLDYLEFGKVNVILDNLIARGDIPPINALLVNPLQRKKEYWLNDAYLAMLFKELIPHVKRTYGLADYGPLGMGGVSLGGLISLYAIKNYDARLNFVFSQSAALWVNNFAISEMLSKMPQISAKIYLDYGDFEETREAHLHLAEILGNKNVSVEMKHYPEGHNWGNWRGHLSAALKYVLER